MKRLIAILLAVAVTAGVSSLYAGSGACTKCSCKQWVQKSKNHGSAGQPYAYCKCGHFWENHR